jgi:2-polyprenyl-6-methoxyphenol hydroxylase-like FAD-dependent oxidoreductase
MSTPLVSEPPLTAAVLGGSISGLMASLLLSQKNFVVTLYEKRPDYNRNIQWSCRQIFIDYLSHINEAIAAEFVELVSPIENGFRRLSDKSLKFPNGAYSHAEMPGPKDRTPDEQREACAEALRIPCEKAFRDYPAVGIVRTQLFEAFLREKIEHLENKVTIIYEEAPDCVPTDSGNRYVLVDDVTRKETNYDLIVVCEGAKSKTREDVGIKSIPLSRVRKQISGDVKLPRHGMIIQYQHAKKDKEHAKDKTSTEFMLSLVLSTNDTTASCWVIGDVSAERAKEIDELTSKIEKAKGEIKRLASEIKKAKPGAESLELQNEKARMEAEQLASEKAKDEVEDLEFRKIAARAMLDTERNIERAEYKGVIGVEKVKSFGIQAKISNIAFAGNNLILAGDAVGEGHWSVGGGMHVAGMFHQRHLDKLAEVLCTRPAPDKQLEALKTYSNGVLCDTKTWILLGIRDYYLSVPEDVLRREFEPLVDEVLKSGIDIGVPKLLKDKVAAKYFD